MRAFVDTSALLALSRSDDQHHARAIEIADAHLRSGGRFVSSVLVLSELYSHLLYLRGPRESRRALALLREDPVHEWIAVDASLIAEASGRWLTRYDDQKMSLVDAVSFEIMRTRRLSAAFAFDRHFKIAGFELIETNAN